MSELGSAKDYFIKPGYQSRSENLTLETPDLRYWTDDRIEKSAEYQTHVYELVRDLMLKRNLQTFMDVGCGPGIKAQRFLAPIAERMTLVDQEGLSEIVTRIVPNAKFVAVDLEAIDLDLEQRFDLIACIDVLEHLVDPNSCVDFIRRHLAVGGRAVLSTPERDVLRGPQCMASSKPEHVREWNSNEFCAYLANCGMVVERLVFRPQIKLNRVDLAIGKLVSRFSLLRRWAACQVVVCFPDEKSANRAERNSVSDPPD